MGFSVPVLLKPTAYEIRFRPLGGVKEGIPLSCGVPVMGGSSMSMKAIGVVLLAFVCRSSFNNLFTPVC